MSRSKAKVTIDKNEKQLSHAAPNGTNISTTSERICARFTLKTCLVPHWDKFQGQDQRSRSPETKNALSAAVTRQQCTNGMQSLQTAATVDATIQSLLGVIFRACVWCMFGKKHI